MRNARARYVLGVAAGVTILYTAFVLANTVLVGPVSVVPLPWLSEWLYMQDALDIVAAALLIATGAALLNRLLARDEALRRATLENEARIEAQRRLLADTSHELRNPLTVLRANLTVLQREDADPQLRMEATRDAEEEAARLGRLVDDLLLLARGESGEQLVRRPVRLDELMAEVAGEAQEAGTGHLIRVDAAIPVTISADAERLRQVLRNVLGNALRHTPAQTHVSLSLAQRRDEVELTVADDGPGIAPEHLPRVFDRFYRVDDSRTRATLRDGGSGGAGLGLAIVKHVVEAHGGSVEIESALGWGTRVAIRLPVTPPAARPA
ncbi:MAG TPA: HAMP domain-containing sensor histidine kinase [Chloroflexota bacterium]|nr:HAMP domain-containing sensor histidine kinase [Chloroflexota bacterium]